MPNPIRLILALHNHQPVGNFDHVFQRAYDDSYRPFLDVFSRYESLKMSLHVSGSLMEWLAAHQPDYVDRLAELVAQGRIEILGGAYFEPILSMIPARDRIGQIRSYTRWLQNRLGATIRGLWVPERVWEQSLDPRSGRRRHRIHRVGRLPLQVCRPGRVGTHGPPVDRRRGPRALGVSRHERLRYTIPFADPQQSIDYLAKLSDQHPGAVAVFGDDGEKFGTWPETHKHVYDDGWLTSSSTPWCRTSSGSNRPRWPRRSTTCRRWAKSICPIAATAR